MTSLEFIKWYMEEYPFSFISGSYPLHLLHGIEYNDIDVYSKMPNKCLNTNNLFVDAKSLYNKEIEFNGYKFTAQGDYSLADPDFISYKSNEAFSDGVVVNLVVKPVSFLSPRDVFRTFDMHILRTAITNKENLKEVNVQSLEYQRAVSTKFIVVNKKRTSEDRINKYRERFPEYSFVQDKIL